MRTCVSAYFLKKSQPHPLLPKFFFFPLSAWGPTRRHNSTGLAKLWGGWPIEQEKYISMELRPNTIMCAFFSIQIRRGVKKFRLQAPWSQNWCLVLFQISSPRGKLRPHILPHVNMTTPRRYSRGTKSVSEKKISITTMY